MKKISILTGCLFTVALSSCNFLDREPLDAIGKDQFFAIANATALEQYCNDLSSTYKCNFLGADNKQ